MAERERKRQEKAMQQRTREAERSQARRRRREEKDREAEDKRERLQAEEEEFNNEVSEYVLALQRASSVADEQERWELRDIHEEGRKRLVGNQRAARRWAKWRQERLVATQRSRDDGLAEQAQSNAGKRDVWRLYHKEVLWYRYGTSKDWQRAETWLSAQRKQEAQRQELKQAREQAAVVAGAGGGEGGVDTHHTLDHRPNCPSTDGKKQR